MPNLDNFALKSPSSPICSRSTVARTQMVHLPCYQGCFQLIHESLETNPIAADLGKFRVIFFFILKMVYCVYSLKSPR